MSRRFFRIVTFGFILMMCRPETSVAQLAGAAGQAGSSPASRHQNDRSR